MNYRITEHASEQISQILTYSLFQFGPLHQERYRLLLAAAMEDVAADPSRLGAKPVRRTRDIWVYDLRHSRNRLPRGQRVSDPWHKILYRPHSDGIVEILAIVGRSYPSTRAATEGTQGG